MVIPTYKVVDCGQLAEEIHNKDLVSDFHSEFLAEEWGSNGDWALDYAVTPDDPEWSDTLPSLREAYDYLITMCGFRPHETFIWITRV